MPNNVRDYLDFDLGFGRNPITNDLNKRINANAIKQSVKNLVLTHFYEVPFHPEVGSQIFHAIFENFSPMTKLTAERAISDVINNFEPRVTLNSVTVDDKPESNALVISIKYTIINTNRQSEVVFDVYRAR